MPIGHIPHMRIHVTAAPATLYMMPFSCKELEQLLAHMLCTAETPSIEMELSIVTDAVISQMNHQAFALEGPTNILSFPAQTGGIHAPAQHPPTLKNFHQEQVFLGSLMLSATALQREAFLYGQELATHCIHLLAHGMGHLFGHEHGDAMTQFCQSLERTASLLLNAWRQEG